MAQEEKIFEAIQAVKVADKHVLAELMVLKAGWSAGTSAVNNTYKGLMNLVELGKIEKCDGFFRVIGCRSEYKEHSRLLTKSLIEILKRFEAVIYREHVTPIGLRADAIVLITKDNQGGCIILEVMNSETESYFEQKRNAWNLWPDSLDYLSNLFGYRIQHFEIVTSRELIPFLEAAK